MTTMDYATYIAGLPRVIAGAATLFRDAEGRLLLVEPNYRDTWILPGGTVESDAGESPRQAARRETAEEIGLDIEPGALLAVDWVRGKDRPPLVSYLYDGGVLDAAQLSAIRVQESELLSWRMVHWDEAQTLVNREIALRVGAALKALAAGRGPAELEDGVPPNGYDGPSK
ncbi:NUDIX hydrolase [Streptomyces sp. P9-2B-2]|uniref:NUDIX domain-containing protein n=1 Tax=Streptomyces sp. P9-2B-2 TaxID=3057114 RepID=UPI0025B37D49|nr:NUDIX hydrolase [Streptomyces sp. P9-2B-2]WJY41645.1 NUDIX hydrolase [Streptomyces sp. P9-2B-2]